MKLAPKIALLGMFAVVLVTGSVVYLTLSETSENMSTLVTQQLSGDVELGVSRILGKNEEIKQIVRIIARNRTIAKALHLQNSRGINQILNDLTSIYPFINYVLIATPDGAVFAASTRDNLGKRVAGEQLIMEDLHNNPMFVTPPEEGVGVGTPGVDPCLARHRAPARPVPMVHHCGNQAR